MTRLLPTLHEGHAPVFLHLAFDDALDARDDWGHAQDEPTVEFEVRRVPISYLFGRMRTCTDILPERVLVRVNDVAGVAAITTANATYAEAAQAMRSLCVERLKAGAKSSLSGSH